ncbi:MAG: CoA ester lyase [Ardenticatenia bacterium]|nr:CoA ester lyase [Ardenticatenia bacterium]
MNVRARRTLLFMPGDERRKIEKGARLGPDAVIMDLEDGVALNRKDVARETVRTALQEVVFGRAERLVRINPVGSGLEEEDLDVTLAGRPDGYVVPKVESPEQLAWLDERLTAEERARGWPEGGVRLLAILESARGILHAGSIAAATPRLEALIFGAEDFAGDVGARRTPGGWEILYARSAVVVAAAAHGLQAVDTVFTDLHDVEGLRQDATLALQLGFDGKLAIHPRQIPVILDVFTPSAEEVERARRLIAAFEAHQKRGRGAFAHEGKMVDMPMIRAARRVLARAGEGSSAE